MRWISSSDLADGDYEVVFWPVGDTLRKITRAMISHRRILWYLLKLVREPVRKLISSLALFFRSSFSVVHSCWEILTVYAEGGQCGSNQLSIYLCRRSPSLIRNLLICLNQVGNQVRSGGYKISHLEVYLNKDEPFDNLNEIFSCLQLSPMAVDVHFNWCDDVYLRRVLSNIGFDDGTNRLEGGLVTLVGESVVPMERVGYYHSCRYNSLKVPISVETWAKNLLKQYQPGSFIVCMHLPETASNKHHDSIERWRSFYVKMLADFPNIHLFSLNSCDQLGVDWGVDLPNMTMTKKLGYNFLQELALVREGDMFVGSDGSYAVMIIGTGKPFIVLSPSDAGYIDAKGNYSGEALVGGSREIWSQDISAPAEFVSIFRKFYADIVEDRGDRSVRGPA